MGQCAARPVAVMCITLAVMSSAGMARGGSGGIVCGQPGPDIICGNIITFPSNYAAEQVDGQWFDAFSFGQTQCNIGTVNLPFNAFPSNQHPVFAQSMYKLKDGRIEQIGIGWLLHGFTTLAANMCGCGCNGQAGSVLGAGCADSNPASWAGSQAILGPRWQVNGHTGFFPTGGPANPPFAGSTARRLRVSADELEPSSESVQYCVEYLYISAADAAAGNQDNNASHRFLTMTGSKPEFMATVTGPDIREKSAIRAWRASDPEVVETFIDLPNEGLFILAAKATQLSEDTWHYEYALANMNSDLSGQAFTVPLPPGTVITNFGFHDVDYHSGDAINNFTDGSLNVSGEDWQVTIAGDSIQWASETAAQNINANALRWGTMYNFRFDANRPPAHDGMVTLSTFKAEGSIEADTVVPGPVSCAGDIAPFPGSPNGTVDVDDLLLVINQWGSCVPGNCPADADGNVIVDVDDLLAVINAWGPCGK